MSPGLSEILRGECDLASCIHATGTENLSVLTAGYWDRFALAALANNCVASMFKELREDYEFVIVDTSPILPIADSRFVSQYVDSVVLCVFRDISQAPRIRAACEILEAFGVRSVEAVVTGVNEHLGGKQLGYYQTLPIHRKLRAGDGDGTGNADAGSKNVDPKKNSTRYHEIDRTFTKERNVKGSITNRLSIAAAIIGLTLKSDASWMPGIQAGEVIFPAWVDTIFDKDKGLPMQLGPWTGQKSNLDPVIFVATGAKFAEDRIYTDDIGRYVATILRIFHNPDDGLNHTPFNCYEAKGYRMRQEK